MMSQKRYRLFFISIISILLASQSLAAADSTAIHLPFGTGTDQIGRSADNWFPLFFSVSNNNIFIPDYARQRIMIFNLDGSYRASLSGVASLSPRMNYFDSTPKGGFIIFNDGTLYLLDAQGKQSWHINFPFGSIPLDFYCAEQSVFVRLQGASGPISLGIPYTDPQDNKLVSLAQNGREIPLIRNASLSYVWHSGDLAGFSNAQIVDPAETVPSGARFLGTLPDGNSAWLAVTAFNKTIYLVNRNGHSISQAVLEPTGNNQTAWMQVRLSFDSGRCTVYYLSYDESGLIINNIQLQVE